MISGGGDRGDAPGDEPYRQADLAGLSCEVTRLSDDAELIALSGELDDFTAGLELRELFEQCAARGDDVVLDLSRVGFVDSMGLSSLLAAHRRLRSVNRTLVLMAPSVPVVQVLRLTGLDQTIPLAENAEEVGKLLEQGQA